MNMSILLYRNRGGSGCGGAISCLNQKIQSSSRSFSSFLASSSSSSSSSYLLLLHENPSIKKGTGMGTGMGGGTGGTRGGCYWNYQHYKYLTGKSNATTTTTTNACTTTCCSFSSSSSSSSSSQHLGTKVVLVKQDDNDNNNDKREHYDAATKIEDLSALPSSSSSLPSSKTSTTTTTTATSNNNNNNSNSNGSSILPGICLSALTAVGGFQMASAISVASGIPMSGIPCAILLGMGIKNVILTKLLFQPQTLSLQPGITYSTKSILQGGIVCVAAKLSFLDLLSAGSTGIPVVLSSVGAGLVFLPLAGRLVGLPSQMSLLLSAGTSICGVTAITALAPAIQAPPRDVAVAVANTVVFGTVGMICYPYLFHTLCHGGSEHVGLCLGVAIHDTSQVLGAALSYKETFGDEVAFQVAAVTKLMRNLGLAFAIPALTYVHASSVSGVGGDGHHESNTSSSSSSSTTTTTAAKGIASTTTTMQGLNTFSKYIPPFLYAFLAMSMVRTGGDYLLQEDALKEFKKVMDLLGNDASKYALGTAMAGVGLSTNAASLRGVGWKPFAVGGAGALVVGGTGYTVASFLM